MHDVCCVYNVCMKYVRWGVVSQDRVGEVVMGTIII